MAKAPVAYEEPSKKAAEPWTTTELVEMELILSKHGYDPKAARVLQAEGMGPYELEYRIKNDDLERSHRLKKESKANEAQHAYRYADVSFDHLEDAEKFSKLLLKKYPRVAVDVGGTQHGGVVTTDATFEQIVGLLSKHEWKGSYRLSPNASKTDLAAEGDRSAMGEDCIGVHTHTPVKADVAVVAAEASFDPENIVRVVRWTPEGFRSFTTGVYYSEGAAASAGRRRIRAGAKNVYVVHMPATVWTKEHWVTGYVEEKHEARDVVPAGDSAFATLRRDPPPQDVVKRWGTLDGPRKIYDICKSLQTETGECFVIIGVDVQGQVIPADGKPGILIARGQMDRVGVEPDDVAQAVAVLKPAGYVLAHQHPSGRAEPSKADKTLTASIRQAVTTSTYVDHVIVGSGEFHSMRDGKTYKA
jgi:proteasome lid subunit RPN8/RPN11